MSQPIKVKVLPQITQFKGDFKFLSNTVDCHGITLDGVPYSCVESAYQAAKTTDPEARKPFEQMNGYEAKKASRQLDLRPDWSDARIGVMLGLLRQKFSHDNNPDLHDKLLATGGSELIEGNYWGFSLQTGEGENHLGRLLERVRQELRLKQLLVEQAPPFVLKPLPDHVDPSALPIAIYAVRPEYNAERFEDAAWAGMEDD